jgi:Thermostable hemolysin
MSHPSELSATPSCIVPGVQPVLTELRESVFTHFCAELDTKRADLEQFIRGVFAHAFGAELHSYYPNLLAFTTGTHTRGVVGYRDGMVKPLFSEHYLDSPAENVIGIHMDQDIERRHLVEVGNLALAGRGEVRWVIAAMTVFLYAAGYRWVLFTAVKPLYNAFQRLGLKPIQIAKPDPRRLPEGGSNWGRYYQSDPMVCAGDISAGYQKLVASISRRQPLLSTLLQEAFRLGLKARGGYAGDVDKAS